MAIVCRDRPFFSMWFGEGCIGAEEVVSGERQAQSATRVPPRTRRELGGPLKTQELFFPPNRAGARLCTRGRVPRHE